ncbi:MAG: DUF192 domain-containing protein [Spirochaetales bacterium]|nr:DUF192 domain-containing protein [Spirochaetales bacterium]
MSNKLFPLLLGLALVVLPAASCRDHKLKTIDVRLKGKTLHVEVAVTEAEKESGLMDRRSLGPDEGMIFVYDQDQRMHFWMKDTYLPLSIAFLSVDGTILQIEDMQPLDQKTIESRQSARYAFEANRGAFARWGAAVGDKVEFPPGFPH